MQSMDKIDRLDIGTSRTCLTRGFWRAAHNGETASLTDADVSDMIVQVERFVTDYPTN